MRVRSILPDDLPAIAAVGNDDALWEFTYVQNPFTNASDTDAWLHEALRDIYRSFVICDARDGRILGSTRFHDIAEEHKRVEIGWTFLGRAHWRTPVNTRVKRLLFAYAFETWNAHRVYLKANGDNARSRAAIARIGAQYEGTLRDMRYRASDATYHDVSYYSVLAPEWPAVRERLDAMIR